MHSDLGGSIQCAATAGKLAIIRRVQEMIAPFGCPVDRQSLIFKGKELRDSDTVG